MSHKAQVMIIAVNDGLHLAKVLDGPSMEAIGTTPSDAVNQLKKGLRWVAKNEPFTVWSALESAELRSIQLRVRLFYRDGKRRFPASDSILIPVRYVLAVYDDRSLECYLPDWETSFFCPEASELESLMSEMIRGAVATMTPEELRRRLPWGNCEVRTLRIKEEIRPTSKLDRDLQVLQEIADPLGERVRRERSSGALLRDLEVRNLLDQILTTKHNLLLVGSAGCGKSAIVQAAARDLVRNRAKREKKLSSDPFSGFFEGETSSRSDPRLWKTSAGRLIAGMQYLGQWEERLEKAIVTLEQTNGILCVEQLVELVRVGGIDASDSIAAFLKSFINEGRLRLIAESTPESLSAVRGLMPGFAECFQIIRIGTMDFSTTRNLVNRVFQDAKRNEKIEIDPGVDETVTRLFARFMPYSVPPGGPLTLSRKIVQQLRHDKTIEQQVSIASAIIAFSKHTGLPESVVRDDCGIKLSTLERWFSDRVIGQPEAVEAVVRTVVRLLSGMNDPARPIQTLMFTGPTGVGKTQLARSLADYLFSAREESLRMIRLDMSEYGGFGGTDRFLMNSNGEPATWIQKLRANPLTVLLLDEIEKASGEVFDCLLAALDEGRISDRFGRTTTLCGAVIVMTSNVGATLVAPVGLREPAESQELVNVRFNRAIRETFRPEFLNRIDRIVTFRPLNQQMMESLVRKELQDLARREVLVQRNIQLSWTDQLISRLAKDGFDPQMGARPLQRKIEQTIVAPLAALMLAEPQRKSISLDALEILTI